MKRNTEPEIFAVLHGWFAGNFVSFVEFRYSDLEKRKTTVAR